MIDNGPENSIFFDRFEIDLERRRLLRDGESVALKSKAFDLLVALARHRGELLTKDRLFELVWDDQIVEENNLTVHIAALRKALGEKRGDHRFIVTVPGKGYRFVAETELPQVTATVETHSIRRITIQEEVDDTAQSGTEVAVYPDSLSRRSEVSGRVILGLGVLAVLILTVAAMVMMSGVAATDSAEVPFEKGRFTRLTDNGNVSLAALSSDGTRFAFVTSSRGQQALYAGDVSGGSRIELRGPADEEYLDLDIAGDGSGVYYSSRLAGAAEPSLFRVPLLGGPAEKVRDGVRFFALSPDAQTLAFTSAGVNDGPARIELAPVAGGEALHVLSLPRPARGASLAWSSDGSMLAFASSSRLEKVDEIVIVNVDAGEPKTLRFPQWKEIAQVTWLGDNSGLVVSALEGDSWASVPQHRLYSVALSGGTPKLLNDDLSSYETSLDIDHASKKLLTIERRQLNNVWIAPADNLSAATALTTGSFGKYDGLWGLGWMPDQSLIFTTSDTRSVAIARMNADGSGRRLLTTPGKVESALDVSRDGRFVVFHSTRGGGFDIWRMNTDGTDLRQLTFTQTNYQPFISPDGLWIYYKGFTGEKGGLRRIPADGGKPEVINENDTSWGTFSPDGQYIAAVFRKDGIHTLGLYSAADHSLLRDYEMSPSGTAFVGLSFTPDGRSLMYRDRFSGYWTQPIAGGPPSKLPGLPNELLYNFSWSPDGSRLAFVRGQHFRDVVLRSAE